MQTIYLDHAATTPLDPRVLDTMMPVLREVFGNPSSLHAQGRRARYLVEESRERVAVCLGAEAAEVVFTGSATEANNTALGLARSDGGLATSTIEHESVLNTAKRMAGKGVPVRFISPGLDGRITPEVLDEAAASSPALASVMFVNNETGSVSPVRDLAAVCRSRGVLFHCDAVQAAGLFDLSVDGLGVDLMSLSAHKIGGPKGIGCLYVRSGTDFHPLLTGGAQERGRRAGTENVAAIVGFARALELAVKEREVRRTHLSDLRQRLLAGLRAQLGERFVVNSPPEASSPHILNIAFPAGEIGPVDGEMLLLNLDLEGVQVSAGSACTSGALEPSHVLLALGLERATAAAAVRFSLGNENTALDIDLAVDRLAKVCRRMHVL